MNTNTEQKTAYILQKDLPDFKAGTKYTRKKFFHFSGDEVSYFPNTKELDSTSVRGIHKDYVENNPEWFLPEQPKEWEIEAYVFGGLIYNKIEEGKYCCKEDIGVYTFISECALNDATIHTVRRLSDGETFSVGEETEYGVISHFKVLDDTVNLEADVAASLNKESNRGGMAVRFHKNTLVNRMISQILKLPPPTPKEETVKVDEKSKIVSQLDMYNMGYKDAIKYTDAIILETQRKAFEAAREYNTNPNTFYPKPIFEPRLTYPTFADYIQSLKK